MLRLEIENLTNLLRAFQLYPEEVVKALVQAGDEAIKGVLLPTEGLQNYPPITEANLPPEPYYRRGFGIIAKNKKYPVSEQLGKQWYITFSGTQIEVGNRASYAEWLHGEDQANAMGGIGWRKIEEVAEEKKGSMERIYQAWIDRIITKLGLDNY